MTGGQNPKPGTQVAKPYEPTPAERAAVMKYFDRKEARQPSPFLKVSEKDGVPHIGPNHADLQTGGMLLMQATGTCHHEFLDGIIVQLANASAAGPIVDQDKLNFMLAVITGIEPRDQTEAMLAAQMAAIHAAAMTMARKLAGAETIVQQDSAQNAMNKLARTFAAQVETLKRYRTGGEQRVTVQHVTVNDGGQAIVGSVATRPVGGGASEKPTPAP